MINLSRLVAVCLNAGQRASLIIRSIHESGNLQCVEKGSGRDSFTGRPMKDLQTEADRKSEEEIFSCILAHFPNLQIIGEEAGLAINTNKGDASLCDKLVHLVEANLGTSDNYACSDLGLFVDPLDGTGEFVSGRLHCVSVLIGIALKGKPLAGIIVRPFVSDEHPGEFIYGVVGKGAFLDHVRMSPFVSNSAHNVSCIVTSLKREHRVMEILFASLSSCHIVREGGAGWKSWLVATGVVDAYVYPRGGTKLWDVLAGDAIVEALGGCTSDACGRPMCYSPSNLGNVWGIMLSRDPHWHRTVLAPASHAALVAVANDPNYTHWPKGETIPSAAL